MLISAPRTTSLAAARSTIALSREPQQTVKTVMHVAQWSHRSSCNVLSNRHKMSDFEDLGLADGELLTVACTLESAAPDKACAESGFSE